MGITLVLYKPEHPGNLGSVARICSNFGFSDVVLVEPQCLPTDQEAMMMAKHAQHILEGMRVVSDLPKFDLTVMTHGRDCYGYNMVRSMTTPRQLAERLKEVDLKKTSVGIVFGPEGEGLPPEMLRRADIVLSIPTQHEYSSMNLAMSVVVVLYELSLLSGRKDKITERFEPMTGQHRERLLQLVQECLDQWQFPHEKRKDTVRMAWQRMLGRSFLTKREAFAIMAFLKRAQGKR